MKAVLRWCVVPLLATTLVAQTAAKPKPKKASAKAVTAQDVQALKDALAAQQQQIEQLQQQMQTRDAALQQAQQAAQQAQQQLQATQAAASDAQQKAASAESSANEQKDTVSKLSTDLADVKSNLTNAAVTTQDEQKRMSALEGLVGRFRLSGDVRIRDENFFQNCTACADRNRARIRVRLGIDGKLSEDFVGGVALATGSLGDPTTTNETLTNFFDRKTIQLDRGYITYAPVAHKWIQATGGKFAYPWQRTSVTFDPDLNPEGFDEKFSFDLKAPVVKNITGQFMQLLYNEANKTVFSDSFAIGGQVSAKLQYKRWTATPSFLLMKWNQPDAILNASAFSVATSPGEGPGCAGGSPATACFFAPNGMTNATYTDPSGRAHFYSQFLYADFIINNLIQTGLSRLPLNLLVEYQNNLDAKDHPLDSAGNVLTGVGKQSQAYQGDISLGQQKNKNDIQFGYAWLRQEQDSAISSFNESDQRAPTNILQNRFYALWRVRSNVTSAFTYWYGRTLNSNLQHAVLAPGTSAGQTEPHLKRMQIDLIYTF
ncbi:MAG: putative porin [Acidobacteriia bacterium]|nr:putative porin [Terriglobia bacterium]